jgi:hypothetical protein
MKKSELKKLLREEIRKVLKEMKMPKSGQKLDDYDLTDNGYIKEDDMDSWLELFTDETWNVSKYVKLANNWLKSNGYKWQVKSCSSTDDGETITWTIA